MSEIIAGLTSQTVYVKILDSTKTDGSGKTALAYNSAGANAYYTRKGAAAAQITLGTQTVNGAYSSGGFVKVDDTNCPGLYRLDLPDAAVAYAEGVDRVIVSIQFTGASQVDKLIELKRYRYGIVSAGTLAAGGSTTAFTVPAAEKALIQVGDVLCVPSVGGRRLIATYSTSTGAGTVTTAFTGDPSSAPYYVYASAPGDNANPVPADLRQLLGTALTESGAGRLAAALIKLLDVATPTLTAAAANQTGDSFTRLGTPTTTTIAADIAGITGGETSKQTVIDALTEYRAFR